MFIFVLLIIFILFLFLLFYPFYGYRWYLSNGERTIIFQEMAHIGSIDFYKEVDSFIKEKRKDGYKIIFEGIGFKSGYNLDTKKKSILSIDKKNCKYITQPYYLGDLSPEDIVADLSLSSFEQISKSGEYKNNNENQEFQIDEKPETSILEISWRHLLFLKPFFHIYCILYYFLMNDKSAKVDKERERIVQKTAQIFNNRDLIIVYGKMHFQPVYKLLKESDPNLKIIHKEKIRIF